MVCALATSVPKDRRTTKNKCQIRIAQLRRNSMPSASPVSVALNLISSSAWRVKLWLADPSHFDGGRRLRPKTERRGGLQRRRGRRRAGERQWFDRGAHPRAERPALERRQIGVEVSGDGPKADIRTRRSYLGDRAVGQLDRHICLARLPKRLAFSDMSRM